MSDEPPQSRGRLATLGMISAWLYFLSGLSFALVVPSVKKMFFELLNERSLPFLTRVLITAPVFVWPLGGLILAAVVVVVTTRKWRVAPICAVLSFLLLTVALLSAAAALFLPLAGWIPNIERG